MISVRRKLVARKAGNPTCIVRARRADPTEFHCVCSCRPGYVHDACSCQASGNGRFGSVRFLIRPVPVPTVRLRYLVPLVPVPPVPVRNRLVNRTRFGSEASCNGGRTSVWPATAMPLLRVEGLVSYHWMSSHWISHWISYCHLQAHLLEKS